MESKLINSNITSKIKKIFLAFLFVIIIMIFSNVCFGSDSAFYIEDYNINAVVKQNGDLKVEENIKYNFTKSQSGFLRDILYRYTFNGQKDDMSPTSSRYQSTGVENIKVYTSDNGFNDLKEAKLSDESNLRNGMVDVYSIESKANNGYRNELKVYSPVSEGAYKYAKYEYTLKNVSVKYNDKGELYWNFVGGDWENDINKLQINISFEGNVNLSDVLVYPHSYAKNISNSISGKNIVVNVENINPGVAVDTRIVFPVSALTTVSKNESSAYDREELNKIEKNMDFGKFRNNMANSIIYIIIFLAGGLLVFTFIKAVKINSISKPKNKEIDYFYDPLTEFTLGDYSLMMNKYAGYNNSNVLMATILDLSNKKYINLECLKKLKKGGLFSKKIDYDYFVSINPNKNLDELTDYEKNIINFIFENKVSSILNIEELKDKKIELNESFEKVATKNSIITSYTTMVTKENKNSESKIYDKVPKGTWKNYIIALVIIVLALWIDILLVSPLSMEYKFQNVAIAIFGGVCYSIIVIAIISNNLDVLKNELKEEYKKLKGLEKYLNDYSLIKDRYPIEIALWDRYLVFATLFSIADKVSEEFKAELISKGYDEDYIYTTYPLMGMAFHSVAFQSSIGSATSIAGSSSSGGYSGGGRRWRRPVVAGGGGSF